MWEGISRHISICRRFHPCMVLQGMYHKWKGVNTMEVECILGNNFVGMEVVHGNTVMCKFFTQWPREIMIWTKIDGIEFLVPMNVWLSSEGDDWTFVRNDTITSPFINEQGEWIDLWQFGNYGSFVMELW